MVKIDLKIGCVHEDLGENVTMDLIEEDDNFFNFKCPKCGKETILIYTMEK